MSGRVKTIGILGGLGATWATAGCSTGDQPVTYCVDEQNVVVAEQYCEDDGAGGVYFFNSSRSHGEHLKPGTVLKDGRLARSNDPKAREKIGLPAKGKPVLGSKPPKGGFFRSGSSGS